MSAQQPHLVLMPASPEEAPSVRLARHFSAGENIMKRTRQLTITIFVLVLALAGALFWSVTSNIRRARLNAWLTVAVAHGDTAAVISLLNQGADPNTREEGVPPESWLNRVVAIFRHRKPRQTYLGRPLLTHAAGEGYPQIVAALLAKGAAIEAKTDTPPDDYATLGTGGDDDVSVSPIGGTALIAAAANGRTATVSALINAGANVNTEDADGESALIRAAQVVDLKLVRVLLASGADVHTRDNMGYTPLLSATSCGYQQPDKVECAVAQTLLAAGDDVNAANSHGFTALMWTAMNGPPGKDYVQTARLFLAHGAHVNAKNKRGETALSWAEAQKHGHIAALLRQAGAKQ